MKPKLSTKAYHHHPPAVEKLWQGLYLYHKASRLSSVGIERGPSERFDILLGWHQGRTIFVLICWLCVLCSDKSGTSDQFELCSLPPLDNPIQLSHEYVVLLVKVKWWQRRRFDFKDRTFSRFLFCCCVWGEKVHESMNRWLAVEWTHDAAAYRCLMMVWPLRRDCIGTIHGNWVISWWQDGSFLERI